MINFVLALGMMGIVVIIMAVAVAWAIREHLIAQKYRYLIRLHKAIPKAELQRARGAHTNIASGPMWEVTYKAKRGKQEKELIEADTEAELLRKIMKLRDYATIDGYRKI